MNLPRVPKTVTTPKTRPKSTTWEFMNATDTTTTKNSTSFPVLHQTSSECAEKVLKVLVIILSVVLGMVFIFGAVKCYRNRHNAQARWKIDGDSGIAELVSS